MNHRLSMLSAAIGATLVCAALPASAGELLTDAGVPDEALDPLGPRPPQDAAVDEAPREGAEMRPGERFALALREVREALREVDARDVPALGDEPEEGRAHRLADRRHGTNRQ